MILRWLAACVILGRRVLRRVWMLLLRPAFGAHGRHFIFDPAGHYNYANIFVGDDVSIGAGATWMATESRIHVGSKVMFGPNTTLVAGNHNTGVVGQYLYDVHEKRPGDDVDIVIEEDVWVGACAIILKGVHIGRGAVVAAGALVNRDVPAYCVVGGVPARVLSLRFAAFDQMLFHEQMLYPPERRLSAEDLRQSLEAARGN